MLTRVEPPRYPSAFTSSVLGLKMDEVLDDLGSLKLRPAQ
jgi:hypothetical protein